MNPELYGKALEESAQQMPEAALHIWRLLEDREPALLLCCDRNARPFGAALTMLSEVLDAPIPTADQQVHFRKVTAEVPSETLAKHLDDFFAYAQERQQEDPRTKLIVLDDYIGSGRTQYAFRQAYRQSPATLAVQWMTLRGGGTDFRIPMSGAIYMLPWQDRPEVIGVDYDTDLYKKTIQTPESEQFYETMRVSAERIGRVATTNSLP